ncbi:FAD-dependent monooxygenase [Streptomyces sp. NPDC057257]|uniref:FAD-dependent monooxygenase n=1 Tax=Streptomyces sp. NPDC057257 TaxID=3346071 RepID=UPI0036449D60
MMVELPTDPDVLIVGGGPVGLTARALLERWGVRVLLVEKRRELSPFPRSRLVNVRSMEVFRQLGIAARIADAAFAPKYGRIRFRDTLYDRDFASAAMVGVHAPVPESPVIGVVTSQDRLEPELLAAAGAEARFGVELVGLSEDADGVVASLVDHGSGDEAVVRARYVLAADGANSTVRRLLGIGTVGPGALGSFTTVVFDADLSRWAADQPAGVYVTAHGSLIPLYPEGGWAWFGATPEDTRRADWVGLVSEALGAGTPVSAEVLRVQHWVMNAFVAERFGHGRILLAGDAAHAIPITGGLGMNTGVGDVHNLCWKLAGVLQGWAGPGLLDTYEPERRPVAHETLRQAVANAKLVAKAQKLRRDQLRNGEAPSAPIELPWSERYFAQLGLVLGANYRSTAVGTDNGAAPESTGTDTGTRTGTAAGPSAPPDGDTGTGTDYIPTTAPGHRLPHRWLAPDRSTLDTLGEWFTLLTPAPAHWRQQATPPWPLRIAPLPTEHADPYDLGAHGALLVRPDGHIAARWRDRPRSDATVRATLTEITDAPGP